MSERPKALRDELIRTRRKLAALGARALLGWVVACLAGGLMASGVWVLFGLSDAGVAVLQAVGVALVAIAVGGAITSAAGRLRRPDAVARWLDRASPEPESPSFVTAFELAGNGRWDDGRESLRLAQLAVESAEARLDRARAQLLERAQRPARWAWSAAAAAVAALLIFGLAAPDAAWQGASAWAAVERLDRPFERVPPAPRLGDFRITHRFPDYAERPPRTLRGSSGAVRALAGTEVTVETRAAEPPYSATLLLAGPEGDGEPQAVSMTVDGRTLRGRFVLQRAGSYRIRLDGPKGIEQERRGHPIELEPDEVPQVVLLAPDTSPLEVDADDTLELVFRARDDFGLGTARLRWRVLNAARPHAEGTEPLTSASAGRTRYTGRKTVDLAELELRPGDRVSYFVEVADNDTVNGPKFGATRTRELRVYSERDHHREVLSLQKKALDELVHLLGDHLEGGFELTSFAPSLEKARGMLGRSERAAELLLEAEEASRDDPLGRPEVAEAFRQAHQRLMTQSARSERAVRAARRAFSADPERAEAEGRRVVKAQGRMVTNLEKDAVYLADLLDDQRLVDAEALAEELRKEQQALRDALEQYRQEPTEEGRKRIAAQIQRIRERLSSLMEQLASLQKSIPTEYVNQEALNTQFAKDQLSEMERLMEQGDLDAAMAAVDRMLQQTEQTLAELRRGRQELGSREYSEIAQRAREIFEELEDVSMRQRELARRTEEVAEAARDRMARRLEQASEFLDRQRERLRKAREGLEARSPEPPMPDADAFAASRERIGDAERALEAEDFGAAQDVLERAESRLADLARDTGRRAEQAERFREFYDGAEELQERHQAVQHTLEEVKAVRKALSETMPSPESVLSSEERAQLKGMQGEQQDLRGRTQRLQDQLDELSEQLPIVGEAVGESLQKARSAMEGASDRLARGDAPGGLRGERQALEALQKLREQMQQMGRGGSGGGVPMPFGAAPGGGRRKGGPEGDMHSHEKVEIPQPEQYEAPEAFRKDILEAAKEGTVRQFEEAVRRYYEELVK
ncbi:MAG TPA: DUF4175 family protein [Myxococcales bacterium LLY-WYZ-16_1]|nr:DUF4175 family protein [Myxococcales bacterium LLY-WYZ-16_1]